MQNIIKYLASIIIYHHKSLKNHRSTNMAQIELKIDVGPYYRLPQIFGIPDF